MKVRAFSRGHELHGDLSRETETWKRAKYQKVGYYCLRKEEREEG